MQFKRARNKEQFDNRKQNIVETAQKIFENHNYQTVTFSEIAKISDIKRSTIYNYFNNCDEILLDVILNYSIGWLESLKIHLLNNGFVDSLVLTHIQNQNFLKLYHILFQTLEKNVSVDCLVSFKLKLSTFQNLLFIIFKNNLSNNSEEEINQFIISQFAIAHGLYCLTTHSEKQILAMEQVSINHYQFNFKNYCTNAINSLYQGTIK